MKKLSNKLILLSMIIIMSLTIIGCGAPSVNKVREKMEKALYEEYGEEFVVDRIGTRTGNGRTFYEARIYPKAIVGTQKEGDPYYYAQAGIEKKSFGKLGKVGAGYETVQIKLEAEEYLMPKIREVFGNRVLIKPEVKFKKRTKDVKHFSWKIVSGFEELLKKTQVEPELNILELKLYIYIFDRIEDKAEKELRKKQIFDYVQYLKSEGLFRYLEMGVIFIDERVLASSYESYSWKVEDSVKVETIVDGEKVDLPPIELRKEMSEVLQKEIDDVSEEEMLSRMGEMRKSELSYKGINKDNAQASSYLYSSELLNIKYRTALKRGILEAKEYLNKNEILIESEFEYIYINKEGVK